MVRLKIRFSSALTLISWPYVFQIEDATLNQWRSLLKQSYGRVGDEAITEAWDYMQTVVSSVRTK